MRPPVAATFMIWRIVPVVRALAVTLIAVLAEVSCVSAQEPAELPWSRGTPMPTARSEIAVTEIGGRIYVAGGIGRWGTTGAMESFDPGSDEWIELAPLPVGLHHLGMVSAAGRIYVSGGYRNLSFDADRKEAWVYDLANDRWQRIADMPGPRAAHRMAAIGDKLYVVGGVGPDPQALWVYDPVADTWETARAPLPTAREHIAIAVLEEKLYVIGGRWSSEGNLAVVERYDPTTDRWVRLPNMPTPRGGHTAAAVAGQIHVTGGEAFSPGRTFAEHEVFDPSTGRWIALAPLPTARHGLDSAALKCRWYVIGGGTGAGVRTLITLTDVVEIFSVDMR